MYIIVTHVDSLTKLPVNIAPLANGPSFPEVKGLNVLWWNQTEWPTDMPLFYGTCDDDAALDIAGVIGSITEEEFLAKRAAEEESFAKQEAERELQSPDVSNATVPV